MPNSTTPRSSARNAPRRVAAAVTACLAASVALTGVAVASDSTPDRPDVFAADTAGHLAQAATDQAHTQETAAKKAADLAKSWVKPIAGPYTLTASFGNSGERWAAKHSGQDFAVPVGTDVRTVHTGTVVKTGGNGAGDGPAYGNAVVVKHADGTFTQYAHLSKIDVVPGQKVTTGQVIAQSGNTGNSSGPHLHFEVRKTASYGSAVDPLAFLRAQDVTV
ncbi:M23 family metallopeptidase [Streptomyces avicenniae]|uniref:M23 family metallopeptidase n=1 Tax=Streptomyces avicenniae TaxID=500153 RepID=UPI00069AE31B|nr:M23 family metallopeptidase [Streptomyces avicenniae]